MGVSVMVVIDGLFLEKLLRENNCSEVKLSVGSYVYLNILVYFNFPEKITYLLCLKQLPRPLSLSR